MRGGVGCRKGRVSGKAEEKKEEEQYRELEKGGEERKKREG